MIAWVEVAPLGFVVVVEQELVEIEQAGRREVVDKQQAEETGWVQQAEGGIDVLVEGKLVEVVALEYIEVAGQG